jgi:hypothetical protein
MPVLVASAPDSFTFEEMPDDGVAGALVVSAVGPFGGPGRRSR